MYKLYDFECPGCGEVHIDILVKKDELFYCKKCSRVCKKLMSAPVSYTMDLHDIWERNKSVYNFVKPQYKTSKRIL